MKRFLTLASLFLAGASISLAQDYFKQYGNATVKVLNQTSGASSAEVLDLVGMDRGDLILRFPGRKGEVGLPLNTEGLKLQIQFPPSVDQAYKQIEKGEYEPAIETLRPMVYPLMQYFDVPPENMNVHEIVERYIFALVNTNGHEAELDALMTRIPLQSAPPVFSLHALRYVTELVEQDKKQEALQLLNRIPMSADNEAMLKLVMSFANQLRENGNLNEALFLYDRLQQAGETDESKIAILWSAYCNVSLDRTALAGIFLNRAGEFTPEDAPYSLAQLVKAKIELADLDYMSAMEQVAQGVVAVDVSYDWAPELIYTTGLCYEKLDLPDTAREVYKEIILFYPESKWRQEAETALTRLPPPSPKEDAGA